MSSATRGIAPPLGTHVFQIIGLSASEHVRRVDAGRVITVMAEKQSSRNVTDQHFISHSMGEVKTTVVTHDLPVSALFGRS